MTEDPRYSEDFKGRTRPRDGKIMNIEPKEKAYVLINIEIGSNKKIMEALKAIPEVKEAHLLYGVYDIIVLVGSDTMLNLKDAISNKIRQLEEVRSTMTMIVIPARARRK